MNKKINYAKQDIDRQMNDIMQARNTNNYSNIVVNDELFNNTDNYKNHVNDCSNTNNRTDENLKKKFNEKEKIPKSENSRM